MICSAVLASETDVFVTVAGDGGEEEFCLSPGRWKRLVKQMEWTDVPPLPFPVTPEFYDRLAREGRATAAVRCAARLQAHSPRSKRELIRKLREKGFDPDIAEEAALFLEQKGYLDETGQAYSFAQSAVQQKRYGKKRISAALLSHGYTSDAIRSALAQIPDAWVQKALDTVIQRKYTPFPTDAASCRKAYAALMRLGFTGGEIQSAIQKAKEKEIGE